MSRPHESRPVLPAVRNDFSSDGRYRFGDAARNIFSNRPDNVFLVKVSYWLSL
ncbi:MAG: hypothetical protein HY705_02480 [Gemmatimonadetes bacterium]|nr:hypothetical protein [Gemmatimonadota bacterium]